MNSKRAHEGYLLVDNRNSPGIPDDVARAAGYPVGAGRGLFEAPTITCSHCQTVVILNPTRVRARAYCSKCDHGICDICGKARELGGECKTMNQVFDEIQESAAQHQQIISLGIIYKE